MVTASIGRDKLVELLTEHVFHPSLYKVTQDIATTCVHCQLQKVSFQVLKLLHCLPCGCNKVPWNSLLWMLYCFPKLLRNFIGCLITVDHYSKWVTAVPIQNKTSKTITNTFEYRILPNPLKTPVWVLYDNSPEFYRLKFNNLLELYRIQHVLTTPYKPSSNRAIECISWTITGFLKFGISIPKLGPFFD